MKRKFIYIVLFLNFILLSFSINSYASTDQVKHFLGANVQNWGGAQTAANNMVSVFNKLGYINVSNSGSGGFETTPYISDVYNYIHFSGNNYALAFLGHGNEGQQISIDQAIGPQHIVGNWHLVILNACSTGKTTAFADAFHINGYSNRGFVGWFTSVNSQAVGEWSGYFNNLVGTQSIRMAHLNATYSCILYTPARFYGDTSWYGWAY